MFFAKHLPPSAGAPRVWVVGGTPDLPPNLDLRPTPEPNLDAVVGWATPDRVPDLAALLRPGGRLILAAPPTHTAPSLLHALQTAGLIHALVEDHPTGTLYRAESPPHGDTLTRVRVLNQTGPATSPFVFLLVRQTPNKPAWKLTPTDTLVWEAATLHHPGQTELLAFTSLTRAVGFMQAAILNRWLTGVNKVGKFPAALAATWPHPLCLNPDFETVRALPLGPLCAVDPHTAITGEE